MNQKIECKLNLKVKSNFDDEEIVNRDTIKYLIKEDLQIVGWEVEEINIEKFQRK
ncbi:MAG: hypothetical protein ACOCT9_01545 [archaeon]